VRACVCVCLCLWGSRIQLVSNAIPKAAAAHLPALVLEPSRNVTPATTVSGLANVVTAQSNNNNNINNNNIKKAALLCRGVPVDG
jgi:hypothetical protein